MSIKGTSILRERNQKRVLEYLRKNKMSSRLEISKALKVSKNTVSLIIDHFIKQGIVAERGSKETKGAGRPSVALSIVPRSCHSVGIYTRSEKIEIIVTDYCFNIIEHSTITITQEDRLLEELIHCCERIVDSYPNVIGIGIGVPGLVNPKTGFVYRATNLNWTNIPLKERIQRKVNANISVFNSVKVAALQAIEDSEEDLHSIFYIRISEGIGGAFIINNSIHLGASWTAGEIGHISVEENGPKCKCGQSGCLERLINVTAFKEAIKDNGFGYYNKMNIRELINDNSSEFIMQELKNCGSYLGKAVSQVIHLLNPQVIIIDSPYNGASIFKDNTVKVIEQKSLNLPFQQTRIEFVDNVYSPAKGAAISVIINFETGES
ncbi:ROK family transcriptional regulator [Pseudalkalibacillus decolorationis]|uniref:ROK family transcriptional regulator n=1 Tax=Pseudalkalibacillus decolorationis TaxID=163879 RepID=UPI002148E1BC|nr:ROK family transcriptional regulator [Pseudalkalibacillus decolorationis]